MGSFSLWHWLIVFVPIAIVAWLLIRSRRSVPASVGPLEGIRGWLALLAFGQSIGVLRLAATVLQNFKGYKGYWEIPGAAIAIYSEIAINVVLIALCLSTTYALFAKKQIFARLFLWQWIAQPSAFILNLLCVSAALNLPVSQLVTGKEVGATFGTFLGTIVWVWYTRVSVRVKNTMVN